jgi:hypothetical protein
MSISPALSSFSVIDFLPLTLDATFFFLAFGGFLEDPLA